MKKILKKVGLIIMAITTMITMNACSKVNNDTANEVCAALSEKYGESFEATKIGDRFNTDSAKLYIHPVGQEDLIFSARIDKNSGEVWDDYVRCLNAKHIENSILSSFETLDISATIKASLSCADTSAENDTNISFEEFATKYSLTGIMLYMPINENNVSEQTVSLIVDTLISVEKKYSVKISVLAYSIPEDKYPDCVDAIKQNPDVSNTWFDSYACNANTAFSVSGGDVTPSIEDIAGKLMGE